MIIRLEQHMYCYSTNAKCTDHRTNPKRLCFLFFFLNKPPTPKSYPFPLPAALPIKGENERLIRDVVIDEFRFPPGKNQGGGRGGADAAGPFLVPAADVVCLRRAAIAWPQQLVV